MSKVIYSGIIQNKEIARGVFKMQLKIPGDYPAPEPGQFVNLYLNDESRLLPRPLSVCDWEDGVLTLVYAVVGAGTKLISTYSDKIRCSTPLGGAYKLEGSGGCILAGGGVGTPPLLFLAKKLAAAGFTDVRAVLGFRSEPFLTEEFPCAVEIATDDGSVGFKGNVIELLGDVPDNSRIFSCGPKPMLKALADYAKKRELSLQVSLEERMGCGYGACVGCTCKTTKGNRKVCEDGPVFWGNEVIWDE